MTHIRHRLAIAAVICFVCAGVRAQTKPQQLPSIRLNAGIYNIQAEVAQSADERATGLMFRHSLPANDGMLFIFEQAGQQCFWMKNTLIPLAVAFVTDDGHIVNTDEMKPQTLDPHCSRQPVRFVLEMNQRWFSQRGIKAGAQLHGAPFGN